jgi:hypothetical protein
MPPLVTDMNHFQSILFYSFQEGLVGVKRSGLLTLRTVVCESCLSLGGRWALGNKRRQLMMFTVFVQVHKRMDRDGIQQVAPAGWCAPWGVSWGGPPTIFNIAGEVVINFLYNTTDKHQRLNTNRSDEFLAFQSHDFKAGGNNFRFKVKL